MAERIGHEHHFEVKTGAVGVQHEVDALGDLPLHGLRPILVRHSRQTAQVLDHQPILFVLVLNPITELSIDGDLGGELVAKPNMMDLEEGHPVLMMADLLLNEGQLLVAAACKTGQD